MALTRVRTGLGGHCVPHRSERGTGYTAFSTPHCGGAVAQHGTAVVVVAAAKRFAGVADRTVAREALSAESVSPSEGAASSAQQPAAPFLLQL